MGSHRFLAMVIGVVGVVIIGGCSSSDSGSPTQAAVYDELGPFTGSLAPVKKDGKWGFIDQNGKLVLSAQYSKVLPFTEGLAGVDVNNKWGFINESGATVIKPGFDTVVPFSESLAAARTGFRDQFGFINKQGSYAISPQFDKATYFSQGLAPVYKGGKWVYVDSTGAVVLTTSYYRAYRFGANGLALVRPVQNGKYGFIARDGSLKLPAIYDEAFEFSSGLAAVRFGKSWSYINTTGNYAIQDTYEFASPFSEGAAGVIQNGKAFYITSTGARALADSYEAAGPFLGGKAIVKSGGISYYIDKTGKNIGIAQKKPVAKAGDGACALGSAVWNSWQGGSVQFALTNTDTGTWNIKYSDYSVSPNRLQLVPGGPDLITDYTKSHNVMNFLAIVPTAAGSGRVPHFDMIMTSADGKANVGIANYAIYNAPPVDDGNHWFAAVRGFVDILKGTAAFAGGDIFGGLYDTTSGAYDMANAMNGDSSTGNKMPTGTGTFYVSSLLGYYNGVPMNPLNGSFCGGDSYTISDGSNLVVEMTAARAKAMPGLVSLNLYKYNTFFALQAAKKFNDWRDPSNGTQYMSGPYAEFMSRVFANYSDPTDSDLCQSTDAGNGFMQTVMGQMSYTDAYNLFDFANNFDQRCKELVPNSTTQTWCGYWASKLPYRCGSATLGLSPLALSSQSASICNWSVTASNSSGALTASGLSGATLAQGSCTSAQSNCTFNVTATSGTSGQMTISDGWNNVPLSVMCDTPGFTASTTSIYSNTTTTYDELITLNNTEGSVVSVNSNNRFITFIQKSCQGKKASCQIDIGCYDTVVDGIITISDGVKSMPFSVNCIRQ